jgi:hypothetical protein
VRRPDQQHLDDRQIRSRIFKVYLPEKKATLEVLTRAHPGLRYYAEATLSIAEQELLQTALAAPREGNFLMMMAPAERFELPLTRFWRPSLYH